MSAALLTDFYALTMANAYLRCGRGAEVGVFDYYFRRVPDGGGFALFAGLEPLLTALRDLRFSAEDIEFLRGKGCFSADFLDYLRNFRFRGEIYSFAEGEVMFPNEPVVTVRAPLPDAQLIETLLLLTLNHQSLIATKAARIALQSAGRPVLEFGARRAHGIGAALYGSRAAYIGGTAATSDTEADFCFGVPAAGTMAHAFVQSFDNEFAAFKAYAETYPDDCVLLVDTFDTLGSGVPNAIRAHQEILAPQGKSLHAIRIDSGDLAYLSRRAREQLDAAGLTQTKIVVSSGLDEFLIKDLLNQNSAIDIFGVGERLITARSEPVFGGVYKLAAIERNGEVVPKIKISSDTVKTTTPGRKQVWRLFDTSGMAIADVVTLHDEHINPNEPYLLFDPASPWKKKSVENFSARPLQTLVYKDGIATKLPPLPAIRQAAKTNLECFWPEVKRLENPHGYYVDFSKPLWELKESLLNNSYKDTP